MNAPVPNAAAREHAASLGGPGRTRRLPTSNQMARRIVILRLTKWLLPAGALLLLASIALWPQLERATEQGRIALRQLGDARLDGATLKVAHYRGTDEHGRAYTVTADTASQVGADRVDLVEPKGDTTTASGGWLLVQSHQGVFMQRQNMLDLSQDVLLYRDDGTTLRTQSATLDLKAGAASGAEATHAEGPFGTLDARGFTVVDKGAVMQFPGPGHLVMNAAEARAP